MLKNEYALDLIN